MAFQNFICANCASVGLVYDPFAGGAALGALLGVAALQLSNILREPDAAGPSESPGPHVALAWLAEKPHHAAEAPVPSASSSSRKASRASAAASTEPAPPSTPSAPAPTDETKPSPSAEAQDLVP